MLVCCSLVGKSVCPTIPAYAMKGQGGLEPILEDTVVIGRSPAQISWLAA